MFSASPSSFALLPAILLWLCAAFPLPAAQPAGVDGILFVRLRWTTNGVTVVHAESRPGRLKGPASRRGTMELRLADGGGAPIWSSLIEDPRLREYEVPAPRPGLPPTRMRVPLETAEVEVRIPLAAGGIELQLWGDPAAATQARRAQAEAAAPVRRLLLRHQLPGTPAPR